MNKFDEISTITIDNYINQHTLLSNSFNSYPNISRSPFYSISTTVKIDRLNPYPAKQKVYTQFQDQSLGKTKSIWEQPRINQRQSSRLRRIESLSQRIREYQKNLYNQKTTQHSLVTQQARTSKERKKQKGLGQLFIQILWVDKELTRIINVFPSQFRQLQQILPSKQLRPLLKLMNTLISSSNKEVKNDQFLWKQHALYMLEKSYSLWQGRWQFEQYRILVQKDKLKKQSDSLDERGDFGLEVNRQLQKILKTYGIEMDTILTRGLIMRYVSDIDNE